jgi:hypothetical protein
MLLCGWTDFAIRSVSGAPAPDAPAPNAAIARPWTIGLLPVSAGIGPERMDLRWSLELALDREIASLPNTQVVDRPHIAMLLDELALSQANQRDLKVGHLVGADVIMKCQLLPGNDAVSLKLTAVETATGKILAQHDADLHTEGEASAAARTFVAALKPRLIRRPDDVDVAFLPIKFDSPIPGDVGLGESLRSRLASRLEDIPHVRLLDREVGQFVLQEASLAAAGLQDPARGAAPVAGMIAIEGTLTQRLVPGKTLDDSVLTLRLTVRRAENEIAVVDESETLKKADAMERAAVGKLRAAVVKALGHTPATTHPATIPAANQADTHVPTNDGADRYWEAQRYLLEAQRQLNIGLSIPAEQERNFASAAALIVKAVVLEPFSTKPYELMAATSMTSEYAGAPASSVAGDLNPVVVVRRQFIDRFPSHWRWADAVFDELEYLESSSAAGENRSAEALALAHKFAEAITAGKATLKIGDIADDPNRPQQAVTNRQTIVMDAAVRLMDHNEYDAAWRMCTAAIADVEADQQKPIGWMLCSDYLQAALSRGHGELAWPAAEYQRQLYPGYPCQPLTQPSPALDAFVRQLHARGKYDRWRPIFDALAAGSRPAWVTEYVEQISKSAEALQRDRKPVEARQVFSIHAGARPVTGDQPSADGSVLAISATSPSDRDEPWVLLHRIDSDYLWRVGSDRPVTLSELPRLQPGRHETYESAPALAAFGGAIYLTDLNRALYRVDPPTGMAARVEGGLPGGMIQELQVIAGSLYAAGGDAEAKKGKAAGFLAQLDRDGGKWRVWLAPDGCGAVFHVFPIDETTFRAFHRSTGQISILRTAKTSWTSSGPPDSLMIGDFRIGATADFWLGWYGFQPLRRQEISRGPAEEIAYLSAKSYVNQEHAWFWRKTANMPHPTQAAPLLDRAVDVIADGPTLWMLDGQGGLTAAEPGKGFAGPFNAADAGVTLGRNADTLYVNTGTSVVAIPFAELHHRLIAPGAWQSGEAIFANIHKQLEQFAGKLSPIARGVYFDASDRPDLAEDAFENAGVGLPVSSMAFRVEALRRTQNIHGALILLHDFIDHPGKIDDPNLELEIFRALDADKRWQEIVAFVPRLWRECPLRGAPVNALYRTNVYFQALQHTATRKDYEDERSAVAAGRLPEVPWRWDANPVFRYEARQIRDAATSSGNITPGKRVHRECDSVRSGGGTKGPPPDLRIDLRLR